MNLLNYKAFFRILWVYHFVKTKFWIKRKLGLSLHSSQRGGFPRSEISSSQTNKQPGEWFLSVLADSRIRNILCTGKIQTIVIISNHWVLQRLRVNRLTKLWLEKLSNFCRQFLTNLTSRLLVRSGENVLFLHYVYIKTKLTERLPGERVENNCW